jgi:Protein of unknown function (DUF2283)
MKIPYFQDTDTLYIEFKETQVAETRDLDENTLLDVDRDGNFAVLPSSTTANAPIFRGFLTSRLPRKEVRHPPTFTQGPSLKFSRCFAYFVSRRKPAHPPLPRLRLDRAALHSRTSVLSA